MKAAVCHEFGAPLAVEDVQIDEPRHDEVKVRVSVCAICHSDILYMDGAWGGTLPAIYGHEAAGVVESVGQGVNDLRPGQAAIISLLRSCGKCYHCLRSHPNLCEGRFETSASGRLRLASGEHVERGLGTACFAEFAIVHRSQVACIPETMNMASASLLACGVMTGHGAVANTAAMESGSHVAVLGTGGVGINAIQAAIAHGAKTLTAIDIDASRLRYAVEFGATHAVNSRTSDPETSVRDITDQRGADYAIVTASSPQAIKSAVSLTRKGGTVVLVGMPAAGSQAEFEVVDFVDNNQVIKGCKMGDATLSSDIPQLISLYENGQLKLDELVTASFPLDQINDAIAHVRNKTGLRTVVAM